MIEKVSLTLARPDEVLQRIRGIKAALNDHIFELADLLAETKQEAYWDDWGYDSFGHWVDESGLDMSERQAYYLISISEKSKELGIPRDQLKLSSMTKLKEIFSLNTNTHGEEIKKLVADSQTQPLTEIQKSVSRAKTPEGQEPNVYKSFSFLESAYENTVKPAIELMQQEYGDTINSSTGEVEDISTGRALEMICADYLAGGQHTGSAPSW